MSKLGNIVRRVIGAPDPQPAPITCADAGRLGAQAVHQNHRAKVRQTAIDLAHSIGRPDLADRVSASQQVKGA